MNNTILNLPLDTIAKELSGAIISRGDNESFTGVTIDSRNVLKGNIFFALSGETFDGNKFAIKSLEEGADLCIIDKILFDIKNIPSNKSIILVEDTEKALGKLAKYYLSTLDIKIVAVTGSVGKTSTKDILAAMLGVKYNVLKTQGNYNNHLGVPLTIFNIVEEHDVAVLEMGMNHMHEIEYLANIANPDIAVITNIGMSHIEHLGSRENILKAKMEIASCFNENNTLIINGDDDMLSGVTSNKFEVIKTGFNSSNNIYVSDMELSSFSSHISVFLGDLFVNFELPLPGRHSVSNFMLGLAVAFKLDICFMDAVDGLKNLDKTGMRLDCVVNNNVTFINDCYNASPSSMKAAIDVLRGVKAKRYICVLGTMKELGDVSEFAHRDVAEYVNSMDIDFVYTTGEHTEYYKDVLKENCFHFETKEQLIENLKKELQPHDAILVKASRGAKFEEIFNSIIK